MPHPSTTRTPKAHTRLLRTPLKHPQHWALSLTLMALTALPGASTAELTADPNARTPQQPSIGTSASGIPLVQITTPTAGGVSRNQYLRYNVDPQGLILNNARIITNTQLGGYIEGNPNLANGPARIILNEVTSTHPSFLRGFTEIAGQRAELILTNPNGITCNGCGFINTQRSVLTTGTPVFDASGGLAALRVVGGHIGIEGLGLNAISGQVDLLARALSVNAEVWAQTLNAITGTNEIRYDTLGVTRLSPDANRPGFALDVGPLGGMYAERIRLLGTETGVGVRSAGTLAASAGDFSLSNAGEVVLTNSRPSRPMVRNFS